MPRIIVAVALLLCISGCSTAGKSGGNGASSPATATGVGSTGTSTSTTVD